MPRKKAAPTLEQQEPRCGMCRHYRAQDEEVGLCYLQPPGIQIDEDGYMPIRPVVEVDEFACGQFVGKQ
jgi:hypothetical protein